MQVAKNVYVPMRDGVHLTVDIYRPDAEGKFPALLAMSPYGKEIQSLPIPPQPRETSPLWDGCIEAGDTEYIVAHGYVHVIADVRGTGYSEGEYVGLFSKQEAVDGYDLVEWIAQQPWCDGNVGMIGISYFAMIQIFIAAEQPPHLKAIFPFDPAWMDTYRRIYTGGILSTFLYGLWDGRDGDSGFAPRNVVSAMMKTLPKPEVDRLFEEALSNPDIRCYSNFYHLLKYPQKNPIFVDFLLNPNDGPFYWERSPHTKFDRVKIPVYTGHVMSAHPAGVDGAISAYLEIDAPKKILLPPPVPLERPYHQYHDELIRWYDYWFKGIDNGIMNEPPIKLFVTVANEWRYEHEWPLARTKWTKLYLRPWGRLSPEPETKSDEPSYFVQQPLYISGKKEPVKYLSPPLPEDTEITGPLALYLYASIDQDDTNWILELNDVDEYGNKLLRPVSRGYLKASHRALDESKSKPWRPEHLHTNPEPVVPGEIYEYAIDLVPCAHLFKAGHRMELEIASMDSPWDSVLARSAGEYHICSSKTTLHKIYHDKGHPAHLLLAVIPKT